jgi:hypothetical protein
MTALELINNKPSDVRNSNELMKVYLQYYFSYVGRQLICAGCTFKSDFKTFVQAVKNGEPKYINNYYEQEMITTTFKLLDPSEIYSYRPKGESVKRCYGTNMTEEFAFEYLTDGTDDEITVRKAQFKLLPEVFIDKPKVAEKVTVEKVNPNKIVPTTKDLK